MKKSKIKQLSVMLSLLVLSQNDINPEELDNILGNSHYIYQEIDNPQYGNILFNAYTNLPGYIKKFLSDNSLDIIVAGNDDYIEKIYKEVYNTNDVEDKTAVTIDYAGNLIAIVEGCSFDIDKSIALQKKLTEEQLIKINLTLSMYHQIGHLIDRYLNDISKSDFFANCFIQEKLKFQYMTAGLFGYYEKNINLSEYFASTFACYLEYTRFFRQNCPYTFEFFEKYLKEGLIKNSKQK